jgi:glutathione peroxidase
MKLLLTMAAMAAATFMTPTGKTVYDFSVKNIDGKEVSLSQYKGKKLLIVNTASECGYTGQYKGLQELSQKYAGKLVVLGFPSNDFGGQEPGTAAEIKQFCTKQYAVTFPMFDKVVTKGANASPLYKFLSNKEENGKIGDAPKWNFSKYLVDEQGHVINFFPSGVKPMSDEITKAIEG